MTDFIECLFCYQIREMFHKISKCYNIELAPHGITIQKAFVLMLLTCRDGINIKDIVPKMYVGNSAITGLLDRMEEDKLVKRQPDPNDRRGQLIFVTERGKKKQKIVQHLIKQKNGKIKSTLSSEDLTAFFRIAKVITTMLDSELGNLS